MKKTTEELLQCPYWIIDILPSQVPENSPGQYFTVEKYFLQGDPVRCDKAKAYRPDSEAELLQRHIIKR